jgi:transposase
MPATKPMAERQTPHALPDWLPDETLYSLVSRHHRLAGNRLASQTCLELFRHRRLGSQHDFPNRLSALCASTGGRLGTAKSLALHRTLLPFYLPFRAASDAEDAVASLLGDTQGMLKFRLGILTSRFRANHPLKACPHCMEVDKATHGTAYWHLMHQYPGVWICRTHGSTLQQSTAKFNGVARFDWVLPESHPLSPPTANPLTGLEHAALTQFASLAQGLAELPVGTRISSIELARTYRTALVARHHMDDANSKLNVSDLGHGFCQAIAPLRIIPELQALPETSAEATPQLTRWLGMPRGGTHPIRHLAIIYWLFEDWRNFWHLHQKLSSSGAGPSSHTAHRDCTPKPDLDRSKLIELLDQGASITRCATTLGIDVKTAMAWAAQAGRQTKRRPKSLKGDSLKQLVEMLRDGADKADAAQRFGISVGTVTQILRSEVGLQTEWHQARHLSAQLQARSAWTSASASAKAVGVKAIRGLQPAAYAWLYRNDKAWLTEQCSLLRQPCMPKKRHRVDWHKRDIELSTDVRRTVEELKAKSSKQRIKLWQICQLLPNLKAKIGALDKLPLTAEAIRAATQSGDVQSS